jgi:hypothetical protein
MQSLCNTVWMKGLSSLVLMCFLAFQVTAFVPVSAVAATASEDLKTIEYKYYFRGNYEKAITELRSFLQRKDLAQSNIIEAREYLAASLILSGATEAGKEQYMQLLKMDSAYPGPDPSVFKPVIISTYEEAKAEYASLVIRTVPETTMADNEPDSTAPTDKKGKPLYKKWWFYATMVAVVLVVAGAAGASGDDTQPQPRDTGTVTVEVGVQ